jgi:hypothetical protein
VIRNILRRSGYGRVALGRRLSRRGQVRYFWMAGDTPTITTGSTLASLSSLHRQWLRNEARIGEHRGGNFVKIMEAHTEANAHRNRYRYFAEANSEISSPLVSDTYRYRHYSHRKAKCADSDSAGG